MEMDYGADSKLVFFANLPGKGKIVALVTERVKVKIPEKRKEVK